MKSKKVVYNEEESEESDKQSMGFISIGQINGIGSQSSQSQSKNNDQPVAASQNSNIKNKVNDQPLDYNCFGRKNEEEKEENKSDRS